MENPRRRDSVPVDRKTNAIQRRKIEMQPITDVVPSRPRRVNHLNQRISFNNSEGYADEVAGAWLANQIGSPLSGYERHAASFVDQGLASAEDLF
jgi:hypothetical protein